MSASRSVVLRGYSLVEMLAVMLVFVVLAAVAVPLYLNTRKTSAARVCKYNVRTLVAAECNYATRFSLFCGDTNASTWEASYTAATTAGVAPAGGLIGAPEGLTTVPVCPLGGKHYSVIIDADATRTTCTITCPDFTTHKADTGTAGVSDWKVTLTLGQADTSNP